MGNELEKEVVDVCVDPLSGNVLPVATDKNDNAIVLEDITLEKMLNEDLVRKDQVTKEIINDVLNSGDYGMSKEDYDVIAEAAMAFQKNKDGYNTKVNYYKMLPQKLQDQLFESIPIEMKARYSKSEIMGSMNSFAKELLNGILDKAFMSQTFYDKATKESLKELNEGLRVEYSKYNSTMRDMINNLPKMVEKLREEGNEESAQKVEKFLEIYNDVYSLDSYKEAWKSGKIKVKKFDIEKFDRNIASFNMKYEKSKNTIPNLDQAYPILRTALPEETSDIKIKKFIVGFVKYTMNMDPNNIEDHAYMYYFVKNIVHSNKYDKANEDEITYYNHVIENINNFINDVIY